MLQRKNLCCLNMGHLLTTYKKLNNLVATAVWKHDNGWASVEAAVEDGSGGYPTNVYTTQKEALEHANLMAKALDVPCLGVVFD